MLARLAPLQPRGAGADRHQRDLALARRLARAERLLAPVRRPPDRPPGLRRLVGRPRADVELPGQLHGRVLRQPRHVQPPRPAPLADRAPAARAATSRRSRAPWRDRVRLRRAGAADRARSRAGSGSRPTAARAEVFDEVVIATHSDQALAMLADPSEAEREVLGAIPYQRNEAALHTDASLLPRRRTRLVELELPPRPRSRPAGSTVTYWMNNLQRLRADREFLVTLNRGEAIDPAKVLHRVRATTTPSTPRRASPPRPATPRSAASGAPTTAAPTGAGASTRTASSAPSRACARDRRAGRRAAEEALAA